MITNCWLPVEVINEIKNKTSPVYLTIEDNSFKTKGEFLNKKLTEKEIKELYNNSIKNPGIRFYIDGKLIFIK